eukprot:3427292-Pleurochrysis_carterae.AAC.1
MVATAAQLQVWVAERSSGGGGGGCGARGSGDSGGDVSSCVETKAGSFSGLHCVRRASACLCFVNERRFARVGVLAFARPRTGMPVRMRSCAARACERACVRAYACPCTC